MVTLLLLIGAAFVLQDADSGGPVSIKPPDKLEDHADLSTVRFLAFSADGSTLLTASDNTVCRWNSTTGERVSRFRPFGILSMDVSPDGGVAAIGEDADNALSVFDTNTGKRLKRLVQEDQARWLRFSPDGQTLAEGG